MSLNPKTWTLATRLIVALTPIALGLYDLAAYFVAGDGATISYNVGLAGIASPLVILAFGYGFGLLNTHLFSLTQATPAPPVTLVRRARR